MRVKDILAEKGTRVVTIHEENLLIDVVSLFFANRIGSLVVVDKYDRILGIVAPNDILRAVHSRPDSISRVSVREVMTRDVIVGTPDDKVGHLMTVMTENRIRHIPIIEDGKLAGLVSIGDLVKAQLTEQDVEIRHLKDYIQDRYPS
ncbi:CBS domain-containing protein [Desulfofustis limnaeus]|jgi:CBS domain-containing protein|uniref:Histidine kinase n=1 Tax=Desulfofustis limnaeus TaxID=2740163 RepID=A0ABM7WEE0_9BACT|nr:CBS domain-containing protein [Desulfofustis limnaeus]MDX9895577.1 CBS domain-containing protein [Desulfofustis sp.]BDD89354.1 histidine kinase [Desulfofustis limnaeus]